MQPNAFGLEPTVREVLERHWVEEHGYTAPNRSAYPWLWLWDSCFHAICWAALGDERATTELSTALSGQSATGFVPHMGYLLDPREAAGFWGRSGWSTITQPPMYGHAAAELTRRGFEPGPELLDRATAGLQFLLSRRKRSDEGLVEVVHPWESGADDSPRWDDFVGTPFDRARWYALKGELMAAVVRSADGSPLANPTFAVAPAGFNALVAFNALELAEVTGSSTLAADARDLVEVLDSRWDPELGTWCDAGPSAGGSGRALTLDGLLPVLVTAGDDRVERVFAMLGDPALFAGRYGPAGVARADPSFDPDAYWRGATWPQLNYLLWFAAGRRGRLRDQRHLVEATVAGALASGMAEYWHPDSGRGMGAIPQSWTSLALVMAGASAGPAGDGPVG
ncbi:MAG: hypothetical protein JJLCMIEE_03502 [Acidimicrobiales bacterium]|nr:hypothetical protein [Acidimicrobiales bacterium]